MLITMLWFWCGCIVFLISPYQLDKQLFSIGLVMEYIHVYFISVFNHELFISRTNNNFISRCGLKVVKAQFKALISVRNHLLCSVVYMFLMLHWMSLIYFVLFSFFQKLIMIIVCVVVLIAILAIVLISTLT